MFNSKAFSASSATSPLASTVISRRDPAENDVQITKVGSAVTKLKAGDLAGVGCLVDSDSIVVDQHFTVRVPSNLDLAAAAPLP